MRAYTKISPHFWVGQTGREIRRSGIEVQLVALYLLSNPHANMLGVYYLPLAYIAHGINLSVEVVRQSVDRLVALGFCHYDADSEYIWVTEMAHFQIDAQLKPTDNRLVAIHRQLSGLPALSFIWDFIAHYRVDFYLGDFTPAKGVSLPNKSDEKLSRMASTVLSTPGFWGVDDVAVSSDQVVFQQQQASSPSVEGVRRASASTVEERDVALGSSPAAQPSHTTEQAAGEGFPADSMLSDSSMPSQASSVGFGVTPPNKAPSKGLGRGATGSAEVMEMVSEHGQSVEPSSHLTEQPVGEEFPRDFLLSTASMPSQESSDTFGVNPGNRPPSKGLGRGSRSHSEGLERVLACRSEASSVMYSDQQDGESGLAQVPTPLFGISPPFDPSCEANQDMCLSGNLVQREVVEEGSGQNPGVSVAIRAPRKGLRSPSVGAFEPLRSQEQEQEQRTGALRKNTTHPVNRARARDELDGVFAYWKQVMAQPSARLDNRRKREIRQALGWGYGVADLCRAIAGCARTPFNMGSNERGQRYDGLHIILKDADQIDRFMRNAVQPPMPQGKHTHALAQWLSYRTQEVC